MTLEERTGCAPQRARSSTSARSRSTICWRPTASTRSARKGGPYRLVLGVEENRLVFDIRLADGEQHGKLMLSLTPFRRVIKDYFMVCESYFKAIPQPDRPTASRPSTWAGAACTTRAPSCCASV